eukprot:g2257.t1
MQPEALILMQILEGLKTLHLNNVVHRDVKLGPGAWKKGDQLEAIKRNDKKEKEERPRKASKDQRSHQSHNIRDSRGSKETAEEEVRPRLARKVSIDSRPSFQSSG